MHTSNIREHMEVYGSDGSKVGTVDTVEGDAIKLTRNDPEANGQHHWVPMDWVANVDDAVRLNKNSEMARREWRSAPTGTTA
ncbi:MAG: hypothetical protein C0501_08275 [Isosphaera sp.]|nr:hypothetical protein [Isosphaera sp.]